ncbi:MAG TPA: BAX inhibitor (BI)-1/YccA family protein, partial [Burkholderiales bacterium]|nr:BAX inhibitor (BI)-1/YccA family protein [Burkholderiales bacterium]
MKPIRTDDRTLPRGTVYDAHEAAAPAQAQKVLRNTYMLLALTMVPTVIGAMIGMRSTGFVLAHPILSTFIMLGGVIGLQFG